ncbi:MAG: DUF4150 domain-containing protein [Paraglaciecola sp.]|nr:DUF4150 domain-containing protein [Paraglaciecola sp.]
MFPAATKAGGQCLAFPDVCKTPAPPAPSPIPIPYPNIGQPSGAKKTTNDVKFCSKEVLTKKSEIPRSSGDEAGVAKGVASSKNMGKVIFKKGSSKVKIQGQQCVYLSVPTAQNDNNAIGGLLSPGQTKVFVGA